MLRREASKPTIIPPPGGLDADPSPSDVARRAASALGREHWVRAVQSPDDPLRFIVSTEDEDRYGDIIVADGWKLSNFRRNPIALFNHSSMLPIGTWGAVKIENGSLVAELELAAPGTSAVVDDVRRLLEQRILRAASVGFRPLKLEAIENSKRGGLRFLESELLEISVVSVPANPHALAVARSLGLSSESLSRIFAAPGNEERDLRPAPYRESAPEAPIKGKTTVTKFAERIKALETDLVSKRDQLTAVVQKDAHDEADELLIASLPDDIDKLEKSLASFKRAQASLGTESKPAGEPGDLTGRNKLSPTGHASIPATVKRGRPADLFIRSALITVRSHVERASPDEIMRRDYGDNRELEQVLRAVTNPAMTSVTGWAAELVETVTGDFLDLLMPESIWRQMDMTRLTFDNGKIRLPGRSARGLNGDFVAEGRPIPVKQGTLTSITLEPYKLAVISALTRELAKYSNPAAEPLIRQMMVDDTVVTLDSLFLGNGAAVAQLRPAGLQALATGANTRASSGTSLANIITDLKAATTQMATLSLGRRPVWIMNTVRLMSLQLATNAAGNFMFRDELAQGKLLGIPFLASVNVPSSVVFLVDAAEMATASDINPEIDISTEATLHMESVAATDEPPTTPDPRVMPIVGEGTGVAGALTLDDIATPVRSLFQTYSLALRLVWPIDWALRRAGGVQTITGVAW
jgi:HK97 family phage major capsid protein/HK97 family phage prohead protease